MHSEREQLKGNTQTMVLAVLADGSQHGYAIAREIERRSENGLKFRDGTLYPALQSLENEGHIVGSWEAAGNGPPRKVYRLTERGKAELETRTQAWDQFTRMINRILKPEPQS